MGLIPALRALDLPVQFDWMHLGIAFWIILTAQSIFVAALLCLITLPRQVVFDPLVDRYRRNPLRIVLLLLYLGILAWAQLSRVTGNPVEKFASYRRGTSGGHTVSAS
jgi:hypothetical protein